MKQKLSHSCSVLAHYTANRSTCKDEWNVGKCKTSKKRLDWMFKKVDICTIYTTMLTLNDFLQVNHTEPPLAISHVGWYLMCTVFRTRRLQHTMNISLSLSLSLTHTHTHTHTNTQLSGLLRPICLEHICQCSIKNPSDKRFKWLPLWVMSSCISEEAFTAQQMKTDEKDHPLRLDLVFVPQ